jgi:phage major head subunit gpT-like protein
MIITNAVLNGLRTALRDEFRTRMAELDAKPVWKILATVIPSTTKSNTYGWLSAFPHMREWVGERVIRDIAESAYQIANQKWESTLEVERTDIEDDNLGQYRVLAAAMADEVERFFNRKLAELLSGGFINLCYDGQPFFDSEHPVYPNTDGTGDAAEVSNIVGTGNEAGTPWFLLCLSGSLKPLIAQKRGEAEFEEITDTKNDRVFMQDKYLYGIRYRGSFGYGLWQQAVGSRAALTPANYQEARKIMQLFARDGGDPLGLVPTHLVVGPENEAAARAILEKQFIDGGDSNPNFHTAELIVFPWLPGLSGNANLSALAVSGGSLSPAFNPLVTEYTVNVANSVSSITVTGTPADAGASVSANSGAAQSLSVGSNTIAITVTAANGTVKTYTVTVTRAGS